MICFTCYKNIPLSSIFKILNLYVKPDRKYDGLSYLGAIGTILSNYNLLIKDDKYVFNYLLNNIETSDYELENIELKKCKYFCIPESMMKAIDEEDYKYFFAILKMNHYNKWNEINEILKELNGS